jgi:hypothetical protein
MSRVRVLRIGCGFAPPSISIEYTNGTRRREYRQFPIVFGPYSDPNALYDTLVTDYPEFFGKQSISAANLRHVVQRIVQEAPAVDIASLPRGAVEREGPGPSISKGVPEEWNLSDWDSV